MDSSSTFSISSVTGNETISPSELPSGGYYESFAWKKLPEEVQLAAGVLGYDKTSWDESLPTNTSSLLWSELTTEEQTAAAVLYYDETSWNAEISTTPTITCAVVESWSYADIPQEFGWAVGALGYDETSWDSSDPSVWPASASKSWDELSQKERKAAKDLGYTKVTWDNDCPSS